ncbi:MAG: hypothetical protein BWX84_01454 [Verrucomicrobia bacterium ADurb.Bin118]|nr:MAG: hypothetical protein BWX84_01454 [Verrucomicrobia bacterium ADurb.Bin118]
MGFVDFDLQFHFRDIGKLDQFLPVADDRTFLNQRFAAEPAAGAAGIHDQTVLGRQNFRGFQLFPVPFQFGLAQFQCPTLGLHVRLGLRQFAFPLQLDPVVIVFGLLQRRLQRPLPFGRVKRLQHPERFLRLLQAQPGLGNGQPVAIQIRLGLVTLGVKFFRPFQALDVDLQTFDHVGDFNLRVPPRLRRLAFEIFF